jgi:dipeptidyl aminopeptidase/acylaminoacyl peptidase
MVRIYGQGLDSPILSRDGSFVLYNNYGQIWKIGFSGDSLDPSSATPVTNSGDGAFGASLSWSGLRLLSYVGTGVNAGVYIGSLSGGSARRIGEWGWNSPDWLPGDSTFTFVGFWPEVAGIGIADTSGTGATHLASEAIYPRAAPDGNHVAFLSHPSLGGLSQIWVMNRDGSQPFQVTTEGSGEGFSWSPDGSEIAYLRFNPTDSSYTNGTIWIVNVSTLQRRQVTFNPAQ